MPNFDSYPCPCCKMVQRWFSLTYNCNWLFTDSLPCTCLRNYFAKHHDSHKQLSSASSHRQSTVATSSTSSTPQSIWPERAWLASCTMRSLLSKSVVNAISSPCALTPHAARMLCQGHLHRLSRVRNTSASILGCSSHSETGGMLIYIYISYIYL